MPTSATCRLREVITLGFALAVGLVIALVTGCSTPQRSTVPMPQPQVSFGDTPTAVAVGLGPPVTPTATAMPPPSPTSVPPTATVFPPTASPTVQPTPALAPIEIPAAGAHVTLPLHLLVRVGSAGDEVTVELRWQDGTSLARPFQLLKGEDGGGLLLESMDWNTESAPPQPPTQSAILAIRSQGGQVLALQDVTVLSPVDPETRAITLYWIGGDRLYPTLTHIPKTQRVGSAAIEELLWGLPPSNLAGFTTSFPTPRQVLEFSGRQPGWGPRVTLRNLTIVNGVATADFSKELRAYGGSSSRANFLRQQVLRTLTQFSTIRRVTITVEGNRSSPL